MNKQELKLAECRKENDVLKKGQHAFAEQAMRAEQTLKSCESANRWLRAELDKAHRKIGELVCEQEQQ
jgi:hypothetical protein